MSNQNNPYPDVTNQPLLNNQNSGQGYNNQGYNSPHSPHSPDNYQGNNYRQPPPPANYNQPGYNGQGYNNYGQGYAGQPQGQGFNPGGQVIVNVAGRGLMCPICRRQTDNFPRKTPGGVTWIWCFGLFIFTGICCCIPFCVDSCQDTELVCVVCQCVKARQQANCC